MIGESHEARRLGGLLLAVGGTGFLVGGLLHPQPAGAETFHDAMVSMLSDPLWPAAHWTELVAGLILVWALSLLVDGGWTSGSVVALAGARLAMIGTLFMSVQWAVEIAARDALHAFSTGEEVPMATLVDAMQGVGWPALGLGFALLALGVPASAPRIVAIAGAAGAISIGLAGFLAQALHFLWAGVLFIGGHLLALWMIWAGARAFVRSSRIPAPQQGRLG